MTQVRGLATYTVPKADVLISAIFRSSPNATAGGEVATNGSSRSANYLMTAAQFAQATGQPLVGTTTSTVNLLLDGQVYGKRVNAQMQLRSGIQRAYTRIGRGRRCRPADD